MAGYDLTNKKFGKLTAIKVAKRDSSGHNHWQCECECGNTVIVRATELLNGKKTMCNSCKRNQMGYSTNSHSFKKSDVTIEDGKQWLENKNIPYQDINNFDNYIDIKKINEAENKNISILSAPIIYKIVHAINADLTYSEVTYIGNGNFDESLAQQIDNFFHIRKQLDDLSVCDWEVGEVIYTAPIYHLLTKESKHDTVTYDDVYFCLKELESKARQNGDYYLAFPRICCGKDKLNWDVVLQIILNIFNDDFNIMLF